MMLKIGITGNIGSGKSYVCSIFKAMQIPVYESDLRARYLMNHDPELISQLQKRYGPEIYDRNQSLDSKRLAAIVFSSESEISQLNALVHPVVKNDFLKWHRELTKRSQTTYCLLESALLFESGFYSWLDDVILVSAPAEVRKKRVMERDGMSEQQFNERQQFQWNEKIMAEKSRFIIYNDGLKPLLSQVLEIDRCLRR